MFNTGNDEEVIFIMYDDIIKSPIPFILNKLQDPELKEGYEDDIDYSKFEGKNDKQLLALTERRITKNIFEYLAKSEFDYEATYNDLLNRYDNIYADSKPLAIAQAIYIMIQQKFVKRIYIYSKVYDERILNDISNLYNKTNNITYVSGNFNDVISKIEERITSYIINDIDYINILIELKKVEYTSILLAKYGFNYTLNEGDTYPILKIPCIEKLSLDNVFKIATFNIDNELEF